MLAHSFRETKTPLPDDIVAEFKKYLGGFKNGKAKEASEGGDGSKGKEALST
jgi:hypothetical protein